MFKNQSFETVGFESSWKNEKNNQDQQQQTTDFSQQNQATTTSTTEKYCMQTQTDFRYGTSFEENVADMDKLAKWLKNIYPAIVDELNDNSLSNAMASCDILSDSSEVNISLIQELHRTDKSEKEINISALSWNCTGNTIAVGSSYKHDIWCHHQGEVKLYSFDRNGKLPENPTKKLTSVSCITSLAFHPVQPSVLSAGTLSGEILIWNIENDGDCLVSCRTGHEERITMVLWITTSDSQPSIVLVTISLDSFMIIWKMQDTVLHIEQKYKLQYFTTKKFVGKSDIISKKTDRGIGCFDFSPYVPGLFILGIEGGLVVKCSLLGAKPIPGNKTTPPTLDPYVNSYKSHEGEVNVVGFSPHRKDLFFTCGTDDEIRIYHIEQESPVQIIFMDITMNTVSWIGCEEKLLVGAGEDGTLKIFSLLNGQQIPNNSTNTKEPVTSMAVNNKRINMLAVGNNEGTLKLWSIPWNNIAVQDRYNIYNIK